MKYVASFKYLDGTVRVSVPRESYSACVDRVVKFLNTTPLNLEGLEITITKGPDPNFPSLPVHREEKFDITPWIQRRKN